jgi:hypothetical protein
VNEQRTFIESISQAGHSEMVPEILLRPSQSVSIRTEIGRTTQVARLEIGKAGRELFQSQRAAARFAVQPMLRRAQDYNDSSRKVAAPARAGP